MPPPDPVPDRGPPPTGAAAFEALFHAYYAPLSEFVYRYVRSREIAHELVQDLFLRIWELSETPGGPEITPAYLYRAARNRALKHLRHERVASRWLARSVGRIPSAPPADRELEGHEVAEAVDRAIAELPERCRLVFTMSRQRELGYGEIAEVLGISVKTVEAQMTKALKVLRRKLGPWMAG